MANQDLEYDCGIEGVDTPELAVGEMKTQLGYSKFLRSIGQQDSESYQTCKENYRRAYDTLVKLGGDRTNFPKRIK